MVSSGILEFFYRKFNFSPRVLLKMAWGTRIPLDQNLNRFYMNQFPTSSDRSGTIAFMRALFDTENPSWKMSSEISKIKQPVLIVWGESDKLISTRNLDRWKKLLPHSQVHVLSDVGHFIAEEAPKDLAHHLETFISRSGAG